MTESDRRRSRTSIVLLLVLLTAVPGCRTVARTTPAPPNPAALAELWHAPEPDRDLFWGVGRQGLAPDPAATYHVLEAKQGGFSEGATVDGPGGRKWNVKFPPEAATEVVASRILWAVGCHQPPIYYLARWNAEGGKTPNPQQPGRFRENTPRRSARADTMTRSRTASFGDSSRRFRKGSHCP